MFFSKLFPNPIEVTGWLAATTFAFDSAFFVCVVTMAESDVVEKKVGFQWSRKLNLDLISARSSRDGLFTDVNYKKKSVWVKIAEDIAKENPGVADLPTGEQCENRWKSLLRTYKGFVDHQGQTGAERRKEPPYYDEMNSAFGWKPNIHPVAVAGPLCGKRKEREEEEKRGL